MLRIHHDAGDQEDKTDENVTDKKEVEAGHCSLLQQSNH